MLKLAPTLIVERIEPSLAFFTTRLGFEKAAEVPGDDGALVFAMVTAGAVEIHLQTKASAGADFPYLAAGSLPPSSFLYIDVADVHSLWERLQDCDILKPLEKTFYGATHFFIKEPGGHVLGFSQNG
jgi:uncharacterized glyoxalase superfamily protein PhnB